MLRTMRFITGSDMFRSLRFSLVLVVAAGALAACGKRGQLDPPPSQTREADAKSGAATSDQPGQTRIGARKRVPITPPKRDLLIDGILD